MLLTAGAESDRTSARRVVIRLPEPLYSPVIWMARSVTAKNQTPNPEVKLRRIEAGDVMVLCDMSRSYPAFWRPWSRDTLIGHIPWIARKESNSKFIFCITTSR